MKLPFLIIIGTSMFVSTHPGKPNQRHLTAEATLPFFGNMPDGEVHAFEVPSSANLRDVYRAIEAAADCFVGSITLHGQTLLKDEGTLVADAGMSAECVIDVLLEPPNDLQILDRAVENPDVDLWPQLEDAVLMSFGPISEEFSFVLRNLASYESFEAAAKELDVDVMVLAERYLSGKGIIIEHGMIVSVDAALLMSDRGASVDLSVLSKLTNLRELAFYRFLKPKTDLYLSGLGRMKEIKKIMMYIVRRSNVPDERSFVIIPDMSQCTKLKKFHIVKYVDFPMTVDCSGSNVTEKIFTIPRNTDLMWDRQSD